MDAWPTGVVTFVFTDIVGSTQLVHALGERYLTLLEDHNRLLRTAWQRHRGVEVKTEGDAFFVAFADQTDAVRACVDAQRALAEQRRLGSPLHVRMGIHTGAAAFVERDYHGISVVIAARIASAAHGDQILASADTLEAARLDADITIRDLGAHGLKGVAEPIELRQITAADLPASFDPPATLRAARHNLPVPPGPLLGRDELVAELHPLLLDEARLVTLVGTGGVGKTRLALEVAFDVLPYLPGGVFLIEAAALSETSALLPRILAALEVEEQDEAPSVEQVARAIAAPTLLVLDNLEHLDEPGVLLAELLAAAPELRILATSRTRLRVRAEQAVSIEPLALPSPDASTLADVDAAPAGALFLERARATDRRRRWSDTDAATVASIVRRLDGLPLALELAAARLGERTLDEIASGIDRAHELLADGDLDLPGRHRSIVATIRWSFELLGESARTVLGAASMFRGGAPRDALEAIVGRAIEEDLRELVAAHLIGRDPDGRVRLLEPVRAAAEALAPDAAAVRASHAAWYLDLAVRSWDGMAGHQEREWIARITPELDNLDVALRALAPDDALTAAAHLGRFWSRTGRARDGALRLRALLRTSKDAHPHRALAHVSLGNLERLLGRLDHAADGFRAGIRLATEDGYPTMVAVAHLMLAEVHRQQGDPDGAVRLSRTALALAVEHRDKRLEAQAAMNLGLAIVGRDLDETLALLREARDAFAEVGDAHNERLATLNLVTVLADAGRITIEDDLVRSLLLEEAPGPDLAARTLATAAVVAVRGGEFERGIELYGAALEQLEATGAANSFINACAGLCSALHRLDRDREALDVARRGLRERLQLGLLSVEPTLPYSAAYLALLVDAPAEALEITLAAEEDRRSGPYAVGLTTSLAIAQALMGANEEARTTLEEARALAGSRDLPAELVRFARKAFPSDSLEGWEPSEE